LSCRNPKVTYFWLIALRQPIRTTKPKSRETLPPKINPSELTIGELISNMKPAQLWGVVAAIVALMAGIFMIGQHFPAK